ncbi:ATPase-like protein 2 [Elsinoe australis]|uniref:ATPase-like protein 2 n=1 Tax=Elsinoe australis TaxID=40998 RepID=A0A4U7BGS5_9PEZI|nr:ATPase-like protein 2 [Elsinoe australis]
MSRYTKRKLEDFDPNKSDSDDGDYDNRGSPVSRPRAKAKSSRAAAAGRKPVKRRRETYGSDDDDIEDDLSFSEQSESFGEESDEEAGPAINPSTGRRQRKAARKPVKYEEDSDEEIQATESEEDTSPRARDKKPQSRPSLIVKLRMPSTRPTRSSRPTSRRGATPETSAAGARRSSRISRHSEEPLLQLTDSGKHTVVTREGSQAPSEEGPQRTSRGSKGVKKLPSAIMEASQEDSGPLEAADPSGFVQQLQEHAQDQDIELNEQTEHATAPDPAEEEDVVPSSDAEAELQAQQEKDAEGDDDDDDEGPINRRPSRSLRARAKQASPSPAQKTTSRRSLRPRKAGAEQSSDFEPEAEDEEMDENVSDDELAGPGRGKPSKSSDSDSGTGRRSGRLAVKRTRGSQRNSARPESDNELDLDEIADEAASLEEDRRRNKRPRRGRRVEEINFEPNLRNRSNRPDYRVFRPELAAQLDADDDGAPPTASQPRGGRKANGPWRTLFSTLGPFGGAGGPAPVFGAPTGAAAVGGADSDSSDDDAIRRPSHAVGGAVGMTPTQGQQPFGLLPQPHNSDAAQAGSGAPANFGKVKDKKALADADPLGVDPTVSFDGVGGLGDHIDRLKEMVALPLLYPEIFMRMHVTPPRGVLFHGPPGTGKTLLARALASSVSSGGKKVTFYMRKGADALSKWVGEAERQLRLLFEEARKNQPSIIFFDEIDGLAPVRSSKQEQIHASIVATLLALMDGMDGRGQVIVIGATNRPDSVDPALRRPGRFDREFYFPLPNKDARRAIIDIHTKGWEPELKPRFKDQLAELTKGYGGADLRALCTEAALNAVQGTYPQIYSSSKKLIIDPSQIKVLAKDFMLSVNKIVPSSERSASTGSAPLKKSVEPLLRTTLAEIESRVNELVPRTKKRTALEEAEYDDRDDELGFEKENLQREFEGARIFRPRLLICGPHGMGQQYLGGALLNKFDGLYVANFDLSNIFKDSTRSSEAAIVQMFEEVKRHKPSVVYIPNVDVWYQSLQDSAIRTFTGLMRSLPPTEPVLLLGIMESQPRKDGSDRDMIRNLFGYSSKNSYVLERPDKDARREFFQVLIDYIRRSPAEFPDPEGRKKREIPQLPEAPAIPEAPKVMTKQELKAQKKNDRHTLNNLKLHIQQVMDQIKQKYRKFRNPPVDERAYAYLLDEQDPDMLTTDLPDDEAQEHSGIYRPYRLDRDKKGVPGLREVATGKFYYNLEIVTIEQRLSNGYYKRPKDFLADIKRLWKDAKTSGDSERIIKANELYTNVEVDMIHLETNQPALVAECEAVYNREVAREREERKKLEEAGQAQNMVSNIPVDITTSTDPSTGPINLGIAMPGQRALPPPTTPQRSDMSNGLHYSNGEGHHQSNGSGPSHEHDDVEMAGSQDTAGIPHRHEGSQQHYTTPAPNTQTQKSQHSSIMQMAPGSQARDYHNSASTTTSGQKTGDRSRSDRSSGHTGNTQRSNGITNGDGPDFSLLDPVNAAGLPDTQEQLSQATPHSSPDIFNPAPATSQTMGPPTHHPNSQQQPPSQSSPRKASDIDSLLNHPSTSIAHPSAGATQAPTPTLISPDPSLLSALSSELVSRSSGLSVEQLEQVMAALMRAIWNSKREWNRNWVVNEVKVAFNETVRDIEEMQEIMRPSQEDGEYEGVGAGRDAMGLGMGLGSGYGGGVAERR